MVKLITSLIGSLIFIWVYEMAIIIYWAASTEEFSRTSLEAHHISGWDKSLVQFILICTVLLFFWLYLRPEPKCDKSDA